MIKKHSLRLSLSAKLHREYLKVKFFPLRNALRSSSTIAKLRPPMLNSTIGKTQRLRNSAWAKPHQAEHENYVTGSVKVFHIIPLDDID